MTVDPDADVPRALPDEREQLLAWLGFLRGSVLRNVAELTDEQARWQPDGALIPLIGVVNHLTHVEWRWIDGAVLGADTDRSEEEFHPGPELTLTAAVIAYQQRALATDGAVRALSLDQRCARPEDDPDRTVRWVLLHLIQETGRHCGHADATRELLDGWTGE